MALGFSGGKKASLHELQVCEQGAGQDMGGSRLVSGALPCPLSDPGLSLPDCSFRQLCPPATAYLPDKWPHCPNRGRAVWVLHGSPGQGWVRTWASARRNQHSG